MPENSVYSKGMPSIEKPAAEAGEQSLDLVIHKEKKGNVAIALLRVQAFRKYYRFMLPTSSLTAATDLSIIACSSASSLNSMILSTPFSPRTQGTPT